MSDTLGTRIDSHIIFSAADDSRTMTREENVAGLSSAIALATECRADYNAHCDDATEHTTAADTVNKVAAAIPTNLSSLIAFVTELLTDYAAHDDDAELGAAWAFHAAQEAGDHSLASVAAPINLQECITRLNDFKVKFNAHDADGTAHGTDSLHQLASANAAYGAANDIPVSGIESGDKISWAILNAGTGAVTGVSAVAYADYIRFTFSADPQNDAIISYIVIRAI